MDSDNPVPLNRNLDTIKNNKQINVYIYLKSLTKRIIIQLLANQTQFNTTKIKIHK